ncbi:PREDICTED: adenylate cyclase type 2-like isoform X2 [Drosophila arizonae]|nr:PREDICTED: adenylate cyclase type 2-like isoform X2 [Drosophila arizonae]
MDMICYMVSTVIVILAMWVNVNVKLGLKHKWLKYVTSTTAALCVLLVDMGTNFYHEHFDDWALGTFFDTYIIIMIYMFFPIPDIPPAMGLAAIMSAMYIIYYVVFLGSLGLGEHSRFGETIEILFYYISLNMMCTYFLIMREIVVRASFLDRHQYVMEDIALRSARATERIFLHTILPPQIAQPIQDEIQNRIKIAQKHHDLPSNNKRDRVIAIQMHPNVSILYADIVNYTHLTTTLSVKELVTLLHELYARFDNAASRYAVQRIKFLGDCYYCVAGLIKPDPAHAICCVKLGLCMIDIIREVRDEVQIGIDIRVGVHSGSLFAGVLGSTKLQYDIWGQDVLIANKLEATGMPGQVHVSERTLQMIKNMYEVYPGSEAAREDAYLQKHNIITYLIISINDKGKGTELDSESNDSFNVIQHQESSSGLLLSEELKKMPLGPNGFSLLFGKLFNLKNHQELPSMSRVEIGTFFLNFRNPALEYNYLHQPDYMFKYSVLLAWCCAMSLIYLHLVVDDKHNSSGFYFDILTFVTLSLILLLAWYKKICFWRYSMHYHNYSPLSCTIFRMVDNLQCSLFKRITVYIYFMITYILIVYMILDDCNKAEFQLALIESILYKYDQDCKCFPPWQLTCSVVLIIFMTIIFTRIPFTMKIIVSLFISVIYSSIFLYQFDDVINDGGTTNPYFPAEYAHLIMIIFTICTLYLQERQAEFNNKINYKWREELLKKQEDARITDQSITILLHNILPAHVVNVYLTSVAKCELYYEDYEMVAVMFASLQNFDLTLPNLHILNDIIVQFDQILYFYRDDNLVEKIKIVGCTYMAACGLDLRFSSLISDETGIGDSVFQEIHRGRVSAESTQRGNYTLTEKREEVVLVLTTFALDLMRTLWVCKNNYMNLSIDRAVFNADISIGISCGEVMAGVVGASQVHYDIWGNAVNMASRMDSTGVAGEIQVTEETAVILSKYGIECNYRGMTFVKGLGMLPTYFVGITSSFEFVYIGEKSLMSNSSNPHSSEAST